MYGARTVQLRNEENANFAPVVLSVLYVVTLQFVFSDETVASAIDQGQPHKNCKGRSANFVPSAHEVSISDTRTDLKRDIQPSNQLISNSVLASPKKNCVLRHEAFSTTHVGTVPAKAYISSSSSSSSIRFFSSGGAEWLEPIIGTVLKHLSAYVSLRISENDSDRIRSGCSSFVFLHSFDSIHNLLTRDKFEKKV